MKKYKKDIEKLNKDALRFINIEIIVFIVVYLVAIIFLSDLIRIMTIAVITLFAVVDLRHDINYYKLMKKNNDKLLEAIDNWYSKKTKKFIQEVISSNMHYASSSFKTPNKGIITFFMNRYAIKQNKLYENISSEKPTV